MLPTLDRPDDKLLPIGQIDYPSLSPPGSLVQEIGNTSIRLDYERPSARGRLIFGGLVPWNRVWRTGAGYCTRISFDHPVQVGKQGVPAGRYALLTIPNPDTWMVILNRDTTLYGAYKYDPDLDVARFSVPAEHSDRYYEALTFDLDLIPNDARLYISWAHTQISFPIETGTDNELLAQIDALLQGDETSSANEYANAADYLYFQRTNLMEALTLTEKALAEDPRHRYAWSVQAAVYTHLGHYELALQAIANGKAISETRPMEKEHERAEEVAYWEQEAERIRAMMKE